MLRLEKELKNCTYENLEKLRDTCANVRDLAILELLILGSKNLWII